MTATCIARKHLAIEERLGAITCTLTQSMSSSSSEMEIASSLVFPEDFGRKGGGDGLRRLLSGWLIVAGGEKLDERGSAGSSSSPVGAAAARKRVLCTSPICARWSGGGRRILVGL